MIITRYAIEIGAVRLGFFGLIVVAGLIAGSAVSYWLARRRGEDADALPDMLALGLFGALLVGRLFYVLNPPPSVAVYYDRHWYLTHVLDLQAGPLALWSGGLDAAGLWIGAIAGVAWVIWRRRLGVRAWGDLLTPGVLIMLAIAGWANVVNEQMFGPPTTLPWGVLIGRRVPPYDDLAAYPSDVRFHPTPAYLALWALFVLGVLWVLAGRYRERLQAGDLALLASVLYMPALFAADFLRVDVSHVVDGLTATQIVAALILAVAVVAAVRRWLPSMGLSRH